MHLSGQWFVGEALSSIRRGIGSRLAFKVARHAKRRSSPDRHDVAAMVQGLTVTVSAGRGLSIEDAVGCTAHVVSGRAWITAESAPRDTIVDAGAALALVPGLRLNAGAFVDVATLVITPPRRSRHNVVFTLSRRDDVRVLTVRRVNGVQRVLTRFGAEVGALFRRAVAGARSQFLPYY